jgi:hypothetical protein
MKKTEKGDNIPDMWEMEEHYSRVEYFEKYVIEIFKKRNHNIIDHRNSSSKFVDHKEMIIEVLQL